MTDTLTEKKRVYTSKSSNQKLVYQPEKYLYDNNGARRGAELGKYVEFQNHTFIADEESAAKLGLSFEELCAFIESRDGYNATNAPNAIWSSDAPPDEVSPTFKEVSDAIFAAVTDVDSDRIGEIIKQERDTHNRPQVLQMARAALEQLAGGSE